MKIQIIPILALLFLAEYGQAGPPLLTNDTGTPGDGHWEINAGLSLERSLSNSQIGLRGPDVNYGLGEKIQLKFETAWIFNNHGGGEARNGAGNSALGIKWRFLDEDCLGFALSVYPQLEFNTASYSVDLGLVDPGTKFIFPFQAERRFGPLNVHGELGYVFNQEDHNQWLYGLAFGYRTSEVEWVGEIYGTSQSNIDWANTGLVFNLGFRWKWNHWIKLNASAGRSLHPAAGDEKSLISYVGLQFIF
ncbi:MAG: transporter [Deltaproteobacteria bacterium]|nr:transporter [Deltaproteobacteria bacterium]